MKKYLWNIIGVLALGLIMIWILMRNENPIEMLGYIRAVAPRWILMGFVCIGTYVGVETLIQHILVKKMQKHNSLWNSFKVVMTGQFFNAITPFASGGQPMQAFIMAKQGVPVGTSVSVLMTKFIIYQVVLTMYSLVVLLIEMKFFFTQVQGIVYLSLLGFLLNVGVVAILIASAFMKQRLKRVAFWGVNILKKLKIIKHPAPIKRKIISQIDLFNKNISVMKGNTLLLIKVCLLTFLQLTAYFLIPYAVYRAFGLVGAKMVLIVSAAAFIVMISSFIPVPGSSGVAEGSFFLFFKLFFPTSILPAAVICWRVITFYVPLFIGGVITLLPNQKITHFGHPKI